jgi:transcription antitermination factor NusG
MIWFCVYTDMRRERVVAEAIRAEARQTAFLPMELAMVKRRGKREQVGRPLIPRHLFFGTNQPDASTFERVRAIRGVRRLLSLSADGSPSRVRAEDVERIAAVADELQARFERRWAKRRDLERRKDDTDLVLERLTQIRPEDRAAVLYEMLGRGKKARLKLEDIRQIAIAA